LGSGADELEPNEESGQESEEEGEAPAPPPVLFKNEREKRLWELRQKMNAGRVANTAAVLDEKERLQDPVAWDKKRRTEEWKKKQASEEAKMDAEGEAGADVKQRAPKGREYMVDTAEKVAVSDAKRQKKEKGTFGWDVFNQDSLYRAHKKRIADLQHNSEEYKEQQAALGDRFYVGAQDVTVNSHEPSHEAKERLVEALDKQAKKRENYSRRRMHNPEQDVTFINERNRVFNQKIERAFGEYSADIKSNFERGTAL